TSRHARTSQHRLRTSGVSFDKLRTSRHARTSQHRLRTSGVSFDKLRTSRHALINTARGEPVEPRADLISLWALRALEFDRHFDGRADRDVCHRALLAEFRVLEHDLAHADRHAQIADRRLAPALAINPHLSAIRSIDMHD